MEQQQIVCCFIIQLPRGKEVKVLDYKETVLICLKYIENNLVILKLYGTLIDKI
jgi:hypothetical protein